MSTTKTTKKNKTASGMTPMEVVGTACALVEQSRLNAQLAASLLSQTMCSPDAKMVNVVEGEPRKLAGELLEKNLRALISVTPETIRIGG